MKAAARFFLLVVLCACWPQIIAAQGQFRVMAYNVENLFDCSDDSLKEDNEFLPDSERHWTRSRYWRKLDGLAKVVSAVSAERLPDLIGLCEVENDSVMHDLTRRSSFRALGYRYLTTHSPDVRGIDVALLYQPGSFRLLEQREVEVPSRAEGFRPTRNILYAKGLVLSGDTLHALVCHWPSRLGRTRTSRNHRRLAARTLRCVLDSIRVAVSSPRIVVMGDFNAGAGDHTFREMQDGILHEPSLAASADADIKGTYRYRGIWETIDHILVSRPLLDAHANFRTADGRRSVVAYPFMCEPDPTYGGLRPFRTYQGPIYKGGYSDHFPVVVDFEWDAP